MTSKKRQGKQRQSQRDAPLDKQVQEGSPQENLELLNQDEPQQEQRQPLEAKDIAEVPAAKYTTDEVQRRLRLCSANALELASAVMQMETSDQPPKLIRVYASQRVSDRKRHMLLSWTPLKQQSPTATPIETLPSLEFLSPSGQFIAQLTPRPSDGKKESASAELSPSHRLEIWGGGISGHMGCCFCFTAPHGVPWVPPYGGGSFCAQNENLFVYTAEAIQPEEKAPLDGYLYKETWGEQLLQHSKGRLFVGSVSPSFLASVEPRDSEASYCQASFIPDGSAVVCTELKKRPYRLGLKFCQNRESAIYLASCPWMDAGNTGSGARRDILQADYRGPLPATWIRISHDEDWAAWSARVHEDASSNPLLRFHVAYLALSSDSRETRPHFGISRLRLATVVRDSLQASWRVESWQTIVGPSLRPHDILGRSEASNGDESQPRRSICCVAGHSRPPEAVHEVETRPFAGLYTVSLPQWRSRHVLFTNTHVGYRQTIIAIQMHRAEKGGNVRGIRLEQPRGLSVPSEICEAAAAAAVGQMSLLDSWGPWLLIQTSSPIHVPVLVLAKLRTTFEDDHDPERDPWRFPLVADIVDALSLRGTHDTLDRAIKLHMWTLSLYSMHSQRHWLVRLSGPPRGPEQRALAVVIHGGPHACAICMYSRDVLFLTTLGFDVLVVNYRGSTGFGLSELVSLHGHAGQQDVDDVRSALEEVIDEFGYDRSRCVAVGGSHGGFLSCHLVGQYPDLFRAISTRNPVTYVPGMYASADIPDFVFPESAGEDFVFDRTPSSQSLEQMRRLSPTEFVARIKAAVLIALGGKDLRVPPSQGLLFWKLLNANEKKSKLLWYPEDNHSIDKPTSDADYWANTGVWFLENVPHASLPPL